MSLSPLISQLVEGLRCLPGVGPKSAQRMAFHLLERDRDGAQHLAKVLDEAAVKVGHCERCRTFTEDPMCALCSSPRRNPALLCVVETPADVVAIEYATGFGGHYFVLMGHLSPLDGIGPEDLGMPMFTARLAEGEVREIILATNPTVEGEATAHYITEIAHETGLRVTRIAHGVPLGGELEYVDGGTLLHAFDGRREI